MFLYKIHIDNYIKCPFYFANKVLSRVPPEKVSNQLLVSSLDKSSLSVSSKSVDKNEFDKDVLWVKDSIIEIASKEMKTGEKVPLHYYRMGYTNRFYSKNKHARPVDGDPVLLVNKINNMFSPFATNIFLAFNLPIEIPVINSNVIFRDTVDFLMKDKLGNLTAIEFDSFEDEDSINFNKYYEWVHHRLPYAFLAHSLKQKVAVNIIDPFNFDMKAELSFLPGMFDSLYNDFSRITSTMINKQFDTIIYKNLYHCFECELEVQCKDSLVYNLQGEGEDNE